MCGISICVATTGTVSDTESEDGYETWKKTSLAARDTRWRADPRMHRTYKWLRAPQRREEKAKVQDRAQEDGEKVLSTFALSLSLTKLR